MRARSESAPDCSCPGSAPLPAHVHEAFRAKYGSTILERYGMTETLMIASNPYRGERRAGTVGPPMQHVAVRILAEDGHEVAAGETGELWVRGANVCDGYWRRPDATAAAFVDGWFRTGDIGKRSADGYITLEGRRSDLIISGGFNIYPREIEELLLEQPGVREATVVGVADRVRGEVPVAYLVADPAFDEAAALAHLRTQLASFKIPRGIVRVDSLPRTALGKVQKHLLPPFTPAGAAPVVSSANGMIRMPMRERRAGPRDGHAERSHAQHERAEREVHARAQKPADRCRERERRRAHPRIVLLRKPEAEHGEVSAGKAHEEEHDDERHEAVLEIERPRERERDRHHHPDEVHRERSLAADASATGGRQRHPRIVPSESTPVPIETIRAAPAAFIPALFASVVIAAGSYTAPAHRPMIATESSAAFTIVRLPVRSAKISRRADAISAPRTRAPSSAAAPAPCTA